MSRRVPAHAIPVASLAALTIVSKLPVLHTPAYWDEMAWLQQAAWLADVNLLRAIPGLREPGIFFGHPTGLHLIFAALAKIFGGASLALAHLLIAVFSAIGVCATYLLARRSFEPLVAWTAALLLLLSPVWFAQSGMFLADIPVAALGALATFLALSGRFKAYVVCAACLTLLKETAAAVVLAIAVHKYFEARKTGGNCLAELLRYLSPVAALGAFILIQKAATGQFLWIYDFDVKFVRLTPDRVLTDFLRVNEWIFVHQNRAIFTGLIILGLIFNRTAWRRKELGLFLLLVIFCAWPFTFIYYLPRYLLPVLPLFCILTAAAIFDIARKRWVQLAGSSVVLVLAGATLITGRLSGTGETNLTYLDVVAINRSASHMISQQYPGEAVVGVFPNSHAVRAPLLGYVNSPHPVRTFHDSSDVAGAGVILLSSPSAPDSALADIAQRDPWRRVARFEAPGAWAEVYAATGKSKGGP